MSSNEVWPSERNFCRAIQRSSSFSGGVQGKYPIPYEDSVVSAHDAVGEVLNEDIGEHTHREIQRGPDTIGLCYTHLARRVRVAREEDELPLHFDRNGDWPFYHWISTRMTREGYLRSETHVGQIVIHGLTEKGLLLLEEAS